ncbi:MAG TPA: hypothetical protein VGH20_10315 [Myxococcales bacterium]|jgi:anti-sigma factor RsiW
MHDDLAELLREHRQELRHPMPPGLRRKFLPPRRVPWAMAAASAAAVALVVGFGVGRTTGGAAAGFEQEVVASHVRSLMAEHLQDVASSDRHTVKPWFEGRLDFAPDVRDFAPDFPLVGGRLDYLGTRAVAALVYKRNGHVINLFEWPADGVASPPRLRTLRGYQLFSWRKDGFAFWAVSDLNAAELQQFAQLWQ